LGIVGDRNFVARSLLEDAYDADFALLGNIRLPLSVFGSNIGVVDAIVAPWTWDYRWTGVDRRERARYRLRRVNTHRGWRWPPCRRLSALWKSAESSDGTSEESLSSLGLALFQFGDQCLKESAIIAVLVE
jgi:hypothetical protein